MNIDKYLILINDKDKTQEIEKIDVEANKIKIKYTTNNKIYLYNKHKVSILQDPKPIDPNAYLIYLGEVCLFNISKILDFKTHLRIFHDNGKVFTYNKANLRFEKNALMYVNTKNTLLYLKELAKSIKNEENDFLDKQYEKIDYISEDSIFAKYLRREPIQKNNFNRVKIFPFGLNLSQEMAVNQALTNQMSIIEGPPGTGKTQTILNIIANLMMNNNTVAVVSNNNAAIQNIFDKLDAKDLSFFTAMLGNKDNQEAFFLNQNEDYPKMQNISKTDFVLEQKKLEEDIEHIKTLLHAHNQLAKLSQELDSLLIEQKYFMRLYTLKAISIDDEQYFLNYTLEEIISFWADLEDLQSQNKTVNLFFKIKAIWKYRLFHFSIYSHPIDDIIIFLQKCFYIIRARTLNKEILELKNLLKNSNFEALLEQHRTKSMALFKSYLSKRYDYKMKRTRFDSDILWKDFNSFIKEYPVILSTTHSLKNCTGKNFLYDYLIIDEASQVDIVAGGLALSCARNVVVVGDLKQLPHIIPRELKNQIDSIFDHYSLNPSYHYANNLLLSVSKLFNEVPRTLLKEHYRCHPKIIDFCNKKFYNNELIILTKDTKKTSSPLILYNTAEGNHARGKYNQRQIDIIKNEILTRLHVDSLGIISPFRKQIDKLCEEINQNANIEIDTVHKYQGREKDVIIITTVVDQENEFADDPNLLNVAISRAKDQLYVVISDDQKNKNMKDLVSYIKYNNFEIKQSKIYSIFDLLYQSYAPVLTKYRSKIKNISKYKSENLMNIIIENILNNEHYNYLDKVLNFPLNHLIQDTSILNEKELKFVQNPLTHIDFLIYNKICKEAVLAVEVDGVAFHENNPIQLERDKLKDLILEKYNIPMIRFATNGSEEEKKLLRKLQEINA
ncbi:AAA domain-containing protein [Sulfurospirillum sp. 1612]|uniref:AAA domain-containing protein n=1 Tax=Sulfurospirillum sp. 1612 TaxID=3094835 RepID=UPI002F92F3B2